MIRYRLACPKAHEFEAWFPSSEACDKQIKKKLVACPTCGATKVAKALMAPSVVTSERKAKRPSRKGQRHEAVEAGGEAPVAPSSRVPAQMLTGPQREMLQQLKVMRDKILADAEYVGPRFAEEARKIHNEEAPGRGIYGEASAEEVEELASDGIDVFPIPVLPEDHN
ncbi:MAG: DUF1178 family protein [Hyphomicrobiaceae bacterium]